MKEAVEKALLENLDMIYLRKGKVDVSILNQLFDDRKKEGFDIKTSKLGLIVTVDSQEVQLEDTLARKEKNIGVFTSYSNLLELVENPSVVRLEACSDLVQIDSDTGAVNLRTPWRGPEGDEWDSPGYESFWNGAEQYFQKRIEKLESVGIKVNVL
jgi:hypothetical protein